MSDWVCPCSGCKKAVKQEQKRILEAIESIDVDGQSQVNALGFKILLLEIINSKK